MVYKGEGVPEYSTILYRSLYSKLIFLPHNPSFFFSVFCFFSQAIAFIRHSLMYVLPSVPHTVFITGRQSFFLGHTQVRDPSGALWQTAYIGHFRRRQPPPGESGRKFNQQITFQVLIDLKRLTGSYTFSERSSRLFQINCPHFSDSRSWLKSYGHNKMAAVLVCSKTR